MRQKLVQVTVAAVAALVLGVPSAEAQQFCGFITIIHDVQVIPYFPSIKVAGGTSIDDSAQGCPTGVAVDVSIDGYFGESDWGTYSSFRSIEAAGYGWQTGRTAHFFSGNNIGMYATSVDLGPAPGDCPEGELRYDDGNGGSSECRPTPIVVHLRKGEVRKLTSAADGVLFDLNGDGVHEQISWTPNGNKHVAFLAIDRNENGVIDDGTELWGNFTIPGFGNGFDALARLEPHDGNGQLDQNDSLYSKLLLWADVNHNGVSEPSELQPASNILEAIGLGYWPDTKVDVNGNRYLYRGWALVKGRGDRAPRELPIYDVFLLKQQ